MIIFRRKEIARFPENTIFANMHLSKNRYLGLSLLFIVFLIGCKDRHKIPVKEKELVVDPRSMDSYVTENIESLLAAAAEPETNDSFRLNCVPLLEFYY